MYILPLDQITVHDAPRVGGKALSLGELVRAGLNVPPGIVVTTDAYRAFVELNGLKREHDDLLAHLELNDPEFKARITNFRARLVTQPLPDDIARALGDALRDWVPVHTMAVRSSALAEDLPDNSFAGQYDTFLNQRGLPQILEAVKKCWASLWNERALVYWASSGLARDNVAMGVIIQFQVAATASGVMFTLDPLSGLETEMVIEATWGLGEALVSGHITPDHFVVDWLEGKIITKQIADKGMMVAFAPDEIAQAKGETSKGHGSETPAEKRFEPSLTEVQTLALASLGERIMAHYGAPQDIEWSFGHIADSTGSTDQAPDYFILQSRPLTRIHSRTPEGTWTGANIRPEMPGVVTPLSFSLSVQDELMRASNGLVTRVGLLGRRDSVLDARTIYGHAYWRADKLKALIMEMPGAQERALDESLGIEPLYEGDGRVTPYSLGTRLRRLPTTLKLRRAYAGLWREAEQFREDFGGIEREFLSVQFERIRDNDLGNSIQRLLNFHYRTNYYRLATACLATLAQADLVPMVEALNRTLPSSEKPVVMTDLINVKEIVATARPVLRMWKVARAALISSAVTKVICETPAPDLPVRLQSFEAGRVFWNEVAAYIAEFYYLSDADEDYARPRLDQQPALVLSTLKQLVAANSAANPAASLLERHTRQASEQARANRYLSRGLLNSLLRRRSFSGQLQILRTYIYWQEEMRVLLARTNYLGHRFFVELGRRWAAQGVLDKPGDVFALSGAQMFGLLEGKLTAGDTRTSVERWNRVYAAFRNFSAPWLLGQTTPATRELPNKQTNKYVGIGCSGGRVTGIARVIDDLAGAGKFLSGEILIAPFTNPDWVPLFSLAAAIVMEQGNLLSHEAVVARQVGIPAVLQLKHATRFLQDGQRVTVDGNLGTVSVLT